MSALPLLLVVVIRYSTAIGPVVAAAMNQFGDMTTTAQQNLMGIRVVKAFAREDHEIKKFDAEVRKMINYNLESARISSIYLPAMDFMAAFGITLVIGYGGYLVIHNSLTVGNFIAFYIYVGWIVWPIRVTGYVTQLTKNAVISASRIFEVLDTHAETHMKDGRIELRNCVGRVGFQDVSFSYADGSRALSGINLEVEPGQMVAGNGFHGIRQEHHHQLAAAVLRRHRGRGDNRWPGHSRISAGVAQEVHRDRLPGDISFWGYRLRKHLVPAGPALLWTMSCPPRRRRTCMTLYPACPAATTAGSESAE